MNKRLIKKLALIMIIIMIVVDLFSFNMINSAKSPVNSGETTTYKVQRYNWGTRYYFKDKMSLLYFENKIKNSAEVLAGVVVIGGLPSVGLAAIGSLGIAYLGKVVNDMTYQEQIYQNRSYYLDINWLGFYRIVAY